MSDASSDGTDRTECTDKSCKGDAKYALWMGDQFSRVIDAHETMCYDDGDLHPHVCESCLPRYEQLHGDKGEFVRPVEKLAADGGIEERRTLADDRHDEWPPFVDPQAEYAVCHFCGQTWEPAVVDGFDLSGEDEYYPKMVPVCPEHAGGCR